MKDLNLENLIPSYIPLPVIVIDENGLVVKANSRIGEIFLYDEIEGRDTYSLMGIKAKDLIAACEENTHPLLKRNEKIFKMVCEKVEGSEYLTVVFNDVTAFEDLKDRYNDEKPCIIKIKVDNYDELIENAADEYKVSIPNEIDKAVKAWGESINASVNASKNNTSYMLIFEQRYLDKILASKFEILDHIREIETSTDFPASLSIGLGCGGKNPKQTEEYANQALELALGRGGDQAVVKRNLKVEYFGGKLQSVEKSNKGKSRIIGHALKQLIEQSDKIYIMGHKFQDMDAFGACLGMARLVMQFEKEACIVIDDDTENIQPVLSIAKEKGDYNFISSEKALQQITKESLVVVCDTHKNSLVQCPKLLQSCERVVVIDHHRRDEDYIENPVLAYMESYASSTSELVSEILQYMTKKKSLQKIEAEALLAGMTVDTNGFKLKTGVRTFEAAAWLRRQGADPVEVSRFFREKEEHFRLKAEALADAELEENGIMTAKLRRESREAQTICAQVADQLLKVEGVKAAFVLGRNDKDKTVISARSLGDVNVQLIMEKMGGGGHLTTAASQVDIPVDEALQEIRELLIKQMEDN